MDIERRFPSAARMEAAAEKRIPRFAFEYLRGGIGRDLCQRRNREALDDTRLLPRYLAEADAPRFDCRLLGQSFGAPFGVAPMGMSGMVWPRMDEVLAAAAARHRLPFALSTFATTSLERIRAVAGPQAWFQLYMVTDTSMQSSLIARAEEAGYRVLLVTVDVPTATRREHDIRNGISVPPRIGPRTVLDALLRPAWAWHTLRAGLPVFASFAPYLPPGASFAERVRFIGRICEGHVTPDRLRALRERWPHALVVKGVLSVEDARLCRQIGADALVVSNHGGRQLDAAPAAIEMLPAIRAEVGDGIALIADGGVRSGLDIARMLAAGADFVLLGRAFAYAVGALGARGGDHLMGILKEELRSTMAQLGCESVAGLRRCLPDARPGTTTAPGPGLRSLELKATLEGTN